MRLWSLDPKYLDARGLTALWREGLLAQAVLMGRTRGYVRHPQLIRFRRQGDPVGFISEYLRAVHAESVARGYRFDAARIVPGEIRMHIDVPRGQIEFEWRHLLRKLEKRAPGWRKRRCRVAAPRVHPLFRVVPGGVAAWERTCSAQPPLDGFLG